MGSGGFSYASRTGVDYNKLRDLTEQEPVDYVENGFRIAAVVGCSSLTCLLASIPGHFLCLGLPRDIPSWSSSHTALLFEHTFNPEAELPK